MPVPPLRRRGPIYDDAMKVLAEDDLAAVLSVVGVHGPAEPLEFPSAVSVELPASSRRADLVAATPDGIVHVEFAEDPAPDLDVRMWEYRAASIVLAPDIIRRVTEEATMPVPIRETPMGQLWMAEGRAEGRVEGDRAAVVRVTAALLRKRFGDDPRIAAAAEAMATLSDDERAERVLTAASLDELAPS